MGRIIVKEKRLQIADDTIRPLRRPQT